MTSSDNRPARSFARRVRPAARVLIWLLLGAATLVLGTISYLQAGKSWSDALYDAVQLFSGHADELPNVPRPWTLEIARWLGVILTGYIVLAAIYQFFAGGVYLLRALLARRHVVLTGVGWRARLFLRAYRRQHRTVVVVEKDPGNPYLEECRERGAIVLLGDATEPEMLRRAGVARADVLLCLADDATNLKVMGEAGKLASGRRDPGRPLNCYVHLEDQVIFRELQLLELQAASGGFRQRVFSPYEVAALQLLQQSGINLLECPAPPPHLLIVGLGAMGESLLLAAVHQHRLRNPDPAAAGDRLRVTVVDRQADRRLQVLQARFPELAQFGAVTAVTCDEDAPEMDLGSFAFDAHGHTDVAAAFICLADEQRGLRTALCLARRCEQAGRRFPIVLQLLQNGEIGELFQLTDFKLGQGRIAVFSLLDWTCDLRHLRGVAERIAMAIHHQYVRKQQKAGQVLGSSPALRPWFGLEEKFVRSNLDQAEHIAEFVATVGCRIVRLHSPGADRFAFTRDEIERLAELEHERYRRFKVATDPGKLVQSWKGLTEHDREVTRTEVAAWPAILLHAGFELQRA